MLLAYSVKNFQSFRERVDVSLRLTEKTAPRGWDVTSSSGQRATTALAFLGPNGAGKTSLLKPVQFADWFIRDSFHAAPLDPLQISPHFAAPTEPIEIEFEADDSDGVLWKYVLRLTLDHVLHEALYRKNVGFAYVFVRDWNERDREYVVKQQGFGFAPGEAKKVRPNASLISTALQYGVELAKHLTTLRVQSNLNFLGRENDTLPSLFHAATHFVETERDRLDMVRLLKSWDLGLSDVKIRHTEQPLSATETKINWYPVGIHRGRDGRQHGLPFWEESRGTQTAFVTLSRILPVLSEGGVVVIDELERDLHPHMLEPVLDLFANPATNPHRAQILFTCHAPEVLNLLHKSQVVLVEKNSCESQAWRLDSMSGLRSHDNFYAKYMAGAYGAVPQVD